MQVEARKEGAAVKKNGMWARIEPIIFVSGAIILIASAVLPADFRNSLGFIVNSIVSPFTATMPFYVAVLIICIIINLYFIIIQKYTSDMEFTRAVNQKMIALTMERKEAQVSRDHEKLKSIDERQMALIDEQAEVSWQTTRPIFYVAFVSIPLFWWEYWYLEQYSNAGLFIILPMLGVHRLADTFLLLPYWLWWSMLGTLVLSFIIRKTLNLVIV